MPQRAAPNTHGYHQHSEHCPSRLMKPAVFWDDLRFPASGLNPPGSVNAPTVNTDTGLLEFADNAINVVAGLAQMPHAWVEGSTLEPHVHWVQPGVGDVLWQLEYRLMPAIAGEFPSTWTSFTSTDNRSEYPGTGDWVQITRFPSIEMTGFSISAMVLFKLSRLATSAEDTLALEVPLLEFDIHYQADAPGSAHEFIKS